MNSSVYMNIIKNLNEENSKLKQKIEDLEYQLKLWEGE